MNNNEKMSFLYSWPVIILALCFFWPVGVFLIIKKVSVDRKAAIGAGKFIGGMGIVLYCIAALGLFVSLVDGFAGEDIALVLFFGVAGFVLRRIAKKIKTEAESVKQYLSIIVNDNIRQLDAIASTTGKTYDVVHEDVKKLIDKGYLKNAYIDESTREVVLPNNAPVPQYNANYATANAAPVQSKVVTCPCCGANNTVMGDIGECEYCGSPLE